MSDRPNTITYEGEEVDVTWDRRLCIHIGECGRAEGPLFVGGREPWCQPDLVDADDAAEVARRCPTGALCYTPKEGSAVAPEAPDDHNVIVIANNGPLYLRGDLQMVGVPEDMPGVKFRAALCRCGASQNKPFCDNSHEAEGFVDRGAIGQSGAGCDAQGGPLEVKLAEDGPLLIYGNVQLVTASGRVAWEGTRCALCRCGASQNKPFCDGSHRAAGFEAEGS